MARHGELEAVAPLAHAQLGARAARQWGLPECICSAIEHHHSPLGAADAKARRLSSQVLLSEAVATEVGGSWTFAEPVPFTPALAGSLGMSRRGFEGLCQATSARYHKVMDSYAA